MFHERGGGQGAFALRPPLLVLTSVSWPGIDLPGHAKTSRDSTGRAQPRSARTRLARPRRALPRC